MPPFRARAAPRDPGVPEAQYLPVRRQIRSYLRRINTRRPAALIFRRERHLVAFFYHLSSLRITSRTRNTPVTSTPAPSEGEFLISCLFGASSISVKAGFLARKRKLEQIAASRHRREFVLCPFFCLQQRTNNRRKAPLIAGCLRKCESTHCIKAK